MKRRFPTIRTSLMIFLLAVIAGAEDHESKWPRFRGERGNGYAESAKMPTTWSEDDFDWRIHLPGKGHASPVIWKDRIFITSVDDSLKEGSVFAVRKRDGKILWEKTKQITPYKMHDDNSHATPSPAVDENQVYVLWLSPQACVLNAYTHDGEEVWQAAFDGIVTRHGAGGSPVIMGDMVVFTREQESDSQFSSSWVAVDRVGGQIRWELERETCARNSFSTPTVYPQSSGRPPLLLFASEAHGFTLVNPENGTVVWENDSLFDQRVVSSPVVSQGIIVGSCKGKMVAIRPDLHDGGTEILWTIKGGLAPYVPTPIIVGDLLFSFVDNGTVGCIGLKTGEVLWREKPGGPFYASPILVGTHLVCLTKTGEALVLEAAGSYSLVSENPVGEGSFATPAVAGNRLVLRTFSSLLSLGE